VNSVSGCCGEAAATPCVTVATAILLFAIARYTVIE
jgi:hypothetical protein